MKNDTVIVPISDMHSGGTTALFPGRFWQFEHNNHTPTDDQKAMYAHWLHCAEQVRAARKGKRLVIVHDGDAIDGHHHGSPQCITPLQAEQIDIHLDLMDTFLKAVRFNAASDALYYVKGTEVHTADAENRIAEDLGAVPKGEMHAHDVLRLDVNGRRVVFTHHGPTSGRGPNKGNSFRNWLRDSFYEAINEGQEPPHMLISGHTHDPYYQVYVGRHNGRYFPLRGLICPSWQYKTRYTYKVAPLSLNKIGLQYFEITGAGHISDPVEMLL